ncbi:MAG TPA: GWxTD domain-containing protein [Bacteroidota bacterium]|nr:GWxTD domain-containing protein [Bacteroidota bacterium]
MRRYLLFPVFLAVIVSGRCAGRQADMIAGPVTDVPRISVDLFGFLTPRGNEQKVDIYIEVPYESIRFLKQGDVFRAKYQISLDIHDSTEKLVDEREWDETAETRSFDESISPHVAKLSQKSISLQPGVYEINVQVTDAETKKSSQVKRKYSYRDLLAGPFAISDLMLVNDVDTSTGKKVLSPNVAATIGDGRKGVTVFFEAYNRASPESIAVVGTIRGTVGEPIRRDTLNVWLDGARKSVIFPIRDTSFTTGEYAAVVDCYPLRGGVLQTGDGSRASAVKSFSVRWRGMPGSISDLNLAVEQLQYIADKDTIDRMREAPTEEKRRLFQAFWKRRNPNPASETNEMMDEYYARVAYANHHFSHYLDGWKTDMGMIYIIFGEPSNIERHPFEVDTKPYEIWSYYEQNREFVFIDATGFGDYRLQNPLWDVWRPRAR